MSIKFVVCGLEHSGTTLLSDVFRQVEGIDSGFEVGVLLSNSPKDFPKTQPFYNNMEGGWEISADLLQKISNTESFESFYTGLKENSKAISPNTNIIFDKTPRYFLNLLSCYEKVKVPFICIYKDPRSLVYSDYKRSSKTQSFGEWYENYKAPKLNYLKNTYDNSYLKWKHNNYKDIICVSLEDVCLNTKETLEKVFDRVGLEFKVEYLLLKNLRYEHTRQPQISSRIPFEYLEGLEKVDIETIEKDFQVLEDWFYK